MSKEITKNLKTKHLKDLTKNLTRTATSLAPLNPCKKHIWWDKECDKAFENRHKTWLEHQSKKTEESHQNFKNICKQPKFSEEPSENLKITE